MEIYLDNAATTKVADGVPEIMVQVMTRDYGNPSSKHTKGMEAETYVDNAREIIASVLKCDSKNILFTSGGTEANNQAIMSTAHSYQRVGKHIITTKIEHASIHEPMIALENEGYEVSYLPVDCQGHIIEGELLDSIREDTILVSIIHVNNEVGAVQDLAHLCKQIKNKKKDIIIHIDAIQSFGKMNIYPKRLGIDLLSVSSHKIHGPKGVGFLYHSDAIRLNPYIHGGGQEKGYRSGTENVPGIAGLGKAVELIYKDIDKNREHLFSLKEKLIAGIQEIPQASVYAIPTGDIRDSAPHIVSASFQDVRSEVLLHALAGEGIFVSSGSACSSNHPSLSGTLQAIGVPQERLDSTIRFSFSCLNTQDEIEYTIEALKKHVNILNKFIRR